MEDSVSPFFAMLSFKYIKDNYFLKKLVLKLREKLQVWQKESFHENVSVSCPNIPKYSCEWSLKMKTCFQITFPYNYQKSVNLLFIIYLPDVIWFFNCGTDASR